MSARHSLSRHMLIAAIACVGAFGSDSRARPPTRRRRQAAAAHDQGSGEPRGPGLARSADRREAAAGDRAVPPLPGAAVEEREDAHRGDAPPRRPAGRSRRGRARRGRRVGVEGLELKEAIKLYEGLLKSHPELRAQRRRDVSAVARARSAGAAREGAGRARSAGREISAEPVVHRSAVPSRRNPVQRRPLSRCRARLQRRRQGGSGQRLLRAGPVQARLVAVQAEPRRGERRFVPARCSIAC